MDRIDKRYISTWYLLFIRQGRLHAEPFDPERLEPFRAETPVLPGFMHAIIQVNSGNNPGAGQYGFSDAGTLLLYP